MSRMVLDHIGVDFPVFGANKNLRLSLLSGLTGGRILPERMRRDILVIKALDDVSGKLFALRRQADGSWTSQAMATAGSLKMQKPDARLRSA